jgi:hypothetical protein
MASIRESMSLNLKAQVMRNRALLIRAHNRILRCRLKAAFRRQAERRLQAAEWHSRRNLSCALLIPLVTLIVAGCHKAGSAGQAQPASAALNAQSSAATAQRADVSQIATTTGPLAPGVGTRAENTVRETVEGDVNPFLTDQLRIFVQQQGRLPRTFTEFVRARLDSIPRPPAGKMWAIDSGSSQIKAVSAH